MLNKRAVLTKKTYEGISSAAIIAIAALILAFPDISKNSAYNALKICAGSVVPVLFPLSVVSSLLITSEFFEKITYKLPIGKLFGLGEGVSAPILFGYLFGFPLGVRSAVEMYMKGYISKEQAESLAAVSNNTGPGFIVSFIGAAVWQSRRFGIKLYALQVVTSIAAGLIVNRFLFPIKPGNLKVTNEENRRFPIRFTDAVSSSASAMLNICAYICTFSVLCGFIGKIIANNRIKLLLFSILEITSASQLSAMCGWKIGVSMCAFAVGFSGLSVICQAASFVIPAGLSPKKLIITKVLQGIMCAVFAPAIEPAAHACTPAVFHVSVLFSYYVCAIIIVFLIKRLIKQHKIKKSLDL